MSTTCSWSSFKRHLMRATVSNKSYVSPCATSRHFLRATVSVFKVFPSINILGTLPGLDVSWVTAKCIWHKPSQFEIKFFAVVGKYISYTDNKQCEFCSSNLMKCQQRTSDDKCMKYMLFLTIIEKSESNSKRSSRQKTLIKIFILISKIVRKTLQNFMLYSAFFLKVKSSCRNNIVGNWQRRYRF